MSSSTCDMSSSLMFPSKDELKGAVQGTLLYLSLYFFFFIPFQSLSKFYILKQKRAEARANSKGADDKQEEISLSSVKYYNSQDSLALKGDRTTGNFIEFAILFIPLLWIHAIFVDAAQSFNISVIYTLSRAIYPFVFGKRGLILCSTLPGYMIYFYLIYEIASKFAFA
uniref:Uncharacterized protein n=1 Tax=Ditylum brightwellii TaxID=49249 RepID=A0A7S4SU85_9STRA